MKCGGLEMSDFRVHPVLKSPAVAGVVFAMVGMMVVDAALTDWVRSTGGEVKVTAEDLSYLAESRWAVGVLTGGFAWVSWWMLFGLSKINIIRPRIGVGLLVFGPLLSGAMVWKLHRIAQLPDLQATMGSIWPLPFLWAVLVLLVGIGCTRLGWRSLRMLRGQA
jgi:hypothetical protein